VIKNIDYTVDGRRSHRLDIVLPKNPPSGAPVMIYIHGGAWVIGDKREQGKPMLFELASKGWVGVTINYRLSPKATWPDHIIDCKRAIAWVKDHIAEYGGDPGFVAISGGSAGGHLCALAALTPNDPDWQPGFETADTSVDACVPFYGVMDMTASREGSGMFGPGLRRILEKQVMKKKVAEDPTIFEQASPSLRVHADSPPFFVFQGTTDTLVPVEVARQFVYSLRNVSSHPVAYAELPYAQHAFDILTSIRCQATTAGVVKFLESVRTSRSAAT
jgi:acetyl esterase/lipase